MNVHGTSAKIMRKEGIVGRSVGQENSIFDIDPGSPLKMGRKMNGRACDSIEYKVLRFQASWGFIFKSANRSTDLAMIIIFSPEGRSDDSSFFLPQICAVDKLQHERRNGLAIM